MKLFLTAHSERGKPITKSGNEYIKINIIDEQRALLAFIEAYPNGMLKITLPSDEAFKSDVKILQMRNAKEKYIPRLCKTGIHDNNKFSCIC